MTLTPIVSDLDFIEYATVVRKGVLDSSGFNIPIDPIKLDRLLNINQKLALWVDYGEITPLSLNYPKQLDLLGHSNEPVVILKSVNEREFYLFKLKRFIDADTIFYGRDQKHLIEKCLILWLTNFVNSDKSTNSQFVKYFQVCKNQTIKISHLNNELMSAEKVGLKYLDTLVQIILQDENKANHSVTLSDSAIHYLNGLDFNLESLKPLIIDAYKTAVELNPHSTDIRIKRYFFNETLNPEAASKNNLHINSDASLVKDHKTRPKRQQILRSKPLISKMDRTLLLLDRYEAAVIKLIEAKLPVMGKNIAQFCKPSISAPALTDSINKHTSRIVHCLLEAPDKWPNLRSKYQAIQKIQ